MNVLHPSSKTRVAVVICAALIFIACLPFGQQALSEAEIQVAYTLAAQTVVARLTLEAGLTGAAPPAQTIAAPSPSNPPAEAPAMPTPTSSPAPTSTSTPPVPTDTPAPTATAAPPTFTPIPPACNLVEVVGDITLPPDTLVPASSALNKVWRVRNAGTCAWDTTYTLNYTGGNLVGSATTIFLPAPVPPGGLADLSAPLIAPAYEGAFQSTWMLRNAQGQLFGAGSDGSVPLLVRLRTILPAPAGRIAFDLTAYACSGEWRSSVSRLLCPGLPNSADGYVLTVDRPIIESRQATGYGLWTHPGLNGSGWIQGRLPLYTVRAGDRFLSEIGCLSNSPGCDVFFELGYLLANGSSSVLGRWRERFDGQTTVIDLNLSGLAGQPVYLTLNVSNNGVAQDANAFWLLPRVERQVLPGGYVLTWSQEGAAGAGSCDELRIALNYAASGAVAGQAQAYDCSRGSAELAQRRLTENELNQLLNWVNRLESFTGEVYTSAQGRAILSMVYLQGSGSGAASDADIQALDNFAKQIFRDLTK